MTTGAPASGFNIAVAFEGDLPGLADTEQVRRVVERAEVVGAVKPALVGVFMTLETVIVHHQGSRGDEIARRGARQRGLKILFAFGRADLVFPWMD